GPGALVSKPENASSSLGATQTVDSSMNASLLRLSSSGIGTVFATWERSNAVYVNRFATASWGTAQATSSDPSAQSPDVAALTNANALAVWKETFQGKQRIQSRAFNGAWLPAEVLPATAGTNGDPRADVNSDGNAAVIWLQQSGLGFSYRDQ